MSDQPLTIDDLVARYPGTTRAMWGQHRFHGTGPAYFKVGKRVYYRVEDVLAFEEAQLRTRTDQASRSA